MKRSLLAFTADAEHIAQRHRELWEQFPDEWVAVHDQRVIAHHAEMEAIIAQLRDSGIDPAWTAIEFMSRDPRPLQLHSHPR